MICIQIPPILTRRVNRTENLDVDQFEITGWILFQFMYDMIMSCGIQN
jgi:hypothetical protein